MDGDRPVVNLPQELLLVCADPVSGRVRRPGGFERALGGAVLAELLLAGAISIERERISEVRKVPTGDAFVDRVLADLTAASGKWWRSLRLETWVRRASSGATSHYLAELIDLGFLVERPGRALRMFPVTVHTAPDPHWAKWATARILAELPTPSDPRTTHLATLAQACDLDGRLFRGHADAKAIHRTLGKLTRTTPIAKAVTRVISSDSNASG
jgi:Golgi phosphoprotein 3 (GPP34)